MMNIRAVPLLLALTLVFGATARAGIFDDEEARRQISDTRLRIDDVRRQMDARIATLEATIKSQGLLDLFNTVEALKSDIANLRGQLEVMHNDVESTQKRQRDLYVDLDTRMRKIETAQHQAALAAAAAAIPVTPAVVPPAPGAPGPIDAGSFPSGSYAAPGGAVVPGVSSLPSAPPIVSPSGIPPPGGRSPGAASADVAGEQRAYDGALDQFKSGNYSASLQSFVGFVRQYPRSPLAPSAQYWVGNAYYALRDYRAAIASQRQLIAAYPDSQKIP
ncbi:MAG: YbgF trimerization domain-containing protein, partial [Casimicrobiaceae bacterium]